MAAPNLCHMSFFTVPALTRRNFLPHAVAWADPKFPSDRIWSPYWSFDLRVERAEDVELNGELTVFDGPPLFTGEQLRGTYEVYWHSGDGIAGVTILQSGARPIGGVAAGTYSFVDRGAFVVTTRDGTDLLDTETRLPLGRTCIRGEGNALIASPTGFGDGGIGIDVLLDEQHRTCGYIFNGDLDAFAWEQRILPGETGRLSAPGLSEELRSLPQDSAVEVVTRSGEQLGLIWFVDFEGSHVEATLAGDETPNTVAELLKGFHDREGVPIMVCTNRTTGETAWVTAFERDGDTGRLVIDPDLALGDSPLQ